MRICVELTSCLDLSASWSLQFWPRRLALGVSLVQFRSRILRLVTRRPCSQISAAPSRFHYLDLIVLVSPFRFRSPGLVVPVLSSRFFVSLLRNCARVSSLLVSVSLDSWCEALSLNFSRPYCVDFSVNSCSGKFLIIFSMFKMRLCNGYESI